jgi:hypothetical protein
VVALPMKYTSPSVKLAGALSSAASLNASFIAFLSDCLTALRRGHVAQCRVARAMWERQPADVSMLARWWARGAETAVRVVFILGSSLVGSCGGSVS